MNKRGSWMLWVSVSLAVILVITLFLYSSLFKVTGFTLYNAPKNPIADLSDEVAISNFNEGYVYYLLYTFKAYQLHNIPLTNIYPRLNINVDGEVFGATIRNGVIDVGREEVMNEDITIITSKSELIKMIRNNDYVIQSFGDARSGIDLVASKLVLFSKGYLNLYNNLNGKSVTGNIIRISTD